jgi:hypothetical protein
MSFKSDFCRLICITTFESFEDFLTLRPSNAKRSWLIGTVSGDFLLQVFFVNHLPIAPDNNNTGVIFLINKSST